MKIAPFLRSLIVEKLPEGVHCRYLHALAYRDLKTRKLVFALWPLHWVVQFALWLDFKWAQHCFRPSWIDRALENEPAALVMKHQLENGARYPSIWVQWRRDGSWGCGGWKGKLSLWHTPQDKDPHEHTVSIGQGCPMGYVSLYFDNVGYGCWEMAGFDGVGITERDLQWATLWAVLALKSRRQIGDLRKIERPKP